MKFLLTTLLAALSFCCLAQTPSHWQPMGLTFDRPARFFNPDTTENVIYITGYFVTVNGQQANIIKWDGSNYTLMPLFPMTGVVGDVVRYKGTLYACGAGRIGRLIGSSWKLIDSSNGRYDHMQVLGDKLLIMGSFKKVGGVVTGPLAQWDGTQFSDFHHIDTLINELGWSITTVAEYKGEIYIGGNINLQDKPQYSEMAKWDGQHWVPVGRNGIRGNGLAAVGKMFVWHGDLYISGGFMERDGAPGNNVVRWDGSSFHRLAGGLLQEGGYDGGPYDMTIYHDNIYAVGLFSYADGLPVGNGITGIARWDGQKWCSLGDSIGYDSYTVITGIQSFQDNFYISGNKFIIHGDSSFQYLAKWTGGDYTASCTVPQAVPKEEAAAQNMLYPNPATDRLFIRSATAFGAAVIQDALGRKVAEAAAYDPRRGIDVGALAPGIYFLRTGRGQTARFVKE